MGRTRKRCEGHAKHLKKAAILQRWKTKQQGRYRRRLSIVFMMNQYEKDG